MELIPRRGEGRRRPSMRQVVVVMPSAFTLGNLFFGFWAIVSAFNGNFRWAGWFIVSPLVVRRTERRMHPRC